MARARRGMRGLNEAGARVSITDHLTHLAEAEALDGLLSDALTTIEVAFKANSQEVIYRPNVLTLRGNLWLKRGRSELPDADFREAITLARKMKAKVFELRAATSSARLLQSRDDRKGAHDLLAPIHDWFTEGFDTADLKDAKALLDELDRAS